MSKVNPFHIAIPVHNLETCRTFYREVIGCEEGRSSNHWVDFNFFGHQLVIHLKEKIETEDCKNPVDGKYVPIPHYGVVLPWDTFHHFSKELKNKGVDFIIEPYIRFEGLAGEQATMFFEDPSGSALEFKAFKDFNMIFATD